MALQYFIYPYFIPYFPFFSTVPIFSFSALNSSLSGIDIRYESATGAPEWSPRGADTWSPFSGKIKSMYLYNYYGTDNVLLLKSDGSLVFLPNWNTLNQNSDVFQFDTNWADSSNKYWARFSLLKDGYYTVVDRNIPDMHPKLHRAGDQVTVQYSLLANQFYINGIIYHGEIDPTQ